MSSPDQRLVSALSGWFQGSISPVLFRSRARELGVCLSVLTWVVCSGRLAQKLRQIEALCALSPRGDELGDTRNGDAAESQRVQAAVPLNPSLPVDAVSSAALGPVRWRDAPAPWHTPAAGIGAIDTAKTALSRVKWRTAPPVPRQEVCTAEDAAQMKALTLGVSYRQIIVSPRSLTARPINWVSNQLDGDEGTAGVETEEVTAAAKANRDRRLRNPDAPAILHNKAVRDISPYARNSSEVSRDDMTKDIHGFAAAPAARRRVQLYRSGARAAPLGSSETRGPGVDPVVGARNGAAVQGCGDRARRAGGACDPDGLGAAEGAQRVGQEVLIGLEEVRGRVDTLLRLYVPEGWEMFLMLALPSAPFILLAILLGPLLLED